MEADSLSPVLLLLYLANAMPSEYPEGIEVDQEFNFVRGLELEGFIACGGNLTDVASVRIVGGKSN